MQMKDLHIHIISICVSLLEKIFKGLKYKLGLILASSKVNLSGRRLHRCRELACLSAD